MGLFDELMGAMPEAVPEIKPDTPHYEAVGRFVTSFATAEAAVHMLARHLSGLSDEKARIIFDGMRLPDLSGVIRQFAKLDGISTEVQATIDSCLTQIGLIAKRRHTIVHRSSTFFDGRLMVTNVLTTKSLNSIEVDSFEATELSNMQIDCMNVYLRLIRVIDSGGSSPPAESAIDAFLCNRPWRYKHVPRKTPSLKPSSVPSKQQPQLPASRRKSDDGRD